MTQPPSSPDLAVRSISESGTVLPPLLGPSSGLSSTASTTLHLSPDRSPVRSIRHSPTHSPAHSPSSCPTFLKSSSSPSKSSKSHYTSGQSTSGQGKPTNLSISTNHHNSPGSPSPPSTPTTPGGAPMRPRGSSFDDLSPGFKSSILECRDRLYYILIVLSSPIPAPAMMWIALLTSGCVVGGTVFVMTKALAALTEVKIHLLESFHDNEPAGASMFILYNAALACLAALLVTYISPINTGSGLPETKALLNGTSIPTFLRLETLVTKILSITLVVAAGFPVGKEGPMVHIGAAVCSGVLNAHLFNRKRGEISSAVENTTSGFNRKSTFATIGGAAGIAAAFNAPIGGILYVFEELSTFWSPETTFKAFAVCGFAALSAQVLLHVASEGASAHLESHIIFNVVDHTTTRTHDENSSYTVHGWTYLDLPFFFIIALVCAVISSMYTYGAVKLNEFRAKAKYRSTKVVRVLEVVAVNVFINLCYTCIPLCIKCKTIPVDADESIEFSSWACEDKANEYNPAATLFFGGEEGILKQMLGSTAEHVEWDIWLLVLFSAVYFCLSVLSCGMSMPLGTFIPQVVMGSAVGRIVGELVHMTDIDAGLISGPGSYAFVGAGAMLAGFTRMTCAIAVILVEASGAIGLSVPVMLSIIIARGAADAICPAFDEQMLELKGYEFVFDEPEKGTEMLVAGDIMTYVPSLRESSAAGVIKYALKKCPAEVDAMPIMCDEGHVLLGLIDKRSLTDHLCEMVDEARFEGREEDEPEPKNRRISAFTGIDPAALFVPKTNDKSFGPNARRSSLMKKISELDELKQVSKFSSLEICLTHLVEQCPYTAPTHMPITRVYHLFRRMDLKHLAVVDSQNRIKGLISRHNLLARRTKEECSKIAETSTNHIEHAIEMSIRRAGMMTVGGEQNGGGEERASMKGLVTPPAPPSPGMIGLAAKRAESRGGLLNNLKKLGGKSKGTAAAAVEEKSSSPVRGLRRSSSLSLAPGTTDIMRLVGDKGSEAKL